MAGVSADTGLPPDFTAAMDGGENFLKRLGLLQQTKKDADDSLSSLRIGQDAKAALADAQSKQDSASKALVDAEAKASDVVAKAQAQAQKIISDAAAEHARLKDEAKTISDTAAAKLDDAEKKSSAMMAQATSHLAEAKKTRDEADALKAQHAQAKKTADDAAAQHKSAAEILQARIAKLQAALQEASGTDYTLHAEAGQLGVKLQGAE